MGQPRTPNGFTLVEVVLAIGVVAFSFLGVFALLPVGTQLFHQAMATSVSAEIVQRIASDAEQTDFDTLIDNSVSGNYYALPIRYFDDQGSEVNVINWMAPSSSELAKIIYWVRVRGSLPGPPDPTGDNAACFTSLPSTGSQRFNPRASTFLTIQITSNPAGIDLSGMVNAEYLIDETRASAANLRLQTYSIVISRNKY
jgi:uncharacterized protein (TIGR02598 family)